MPTSLFANAFAMVLFVKILPQTREPSSHSVMNVPSTFVPFLCAVLVHPGVGIETRLWLK